MPVQLSRRPEVRRAFDSLSKLRHMDGCISGARGIEPGERHRVSCRQARTRPPAGDLTHIPPCLPLIAFPFVPVILPKNAQDEPAAAGDRH